MSDNVAQFRQLIKRDRNMLRHAYSWDCRCGDCLSFEIGLRAEVQAEENRLKAARYGATVSVPELNGQVIGQKEMVPTTWNQTGNLEVLDSSLAAMRK